jgi:hypothetical protein
MHGHASPPLGPPQITPDGTMTSSWNQDNISKYEYITKYEQDTGFMVVREYSDPSTTEKRYRESDSRLRLVRDLFDQMIDAPLFQRRRTSQDILGIATPSEVLAVAIPTAGRHIYEGRLLAAASLLGRYGERAWPVLRELARSMRPECECFVPVIARMETIAEDDRIRALTDLARNPDPSTRERVLDAIDEFAPEKTTAVLEALADPQWKGDLAYDGARERLESVRAVERPCQPGMRASTARQSAPDARRSRESATRT